jgi:hypothetical protein
MSCADGDASETSIEAFNTDMMFDVNEPWSRYSICREEEENHQETFDEEQNNNGNAGDGICHQKW